MLCIQYFIRREEAEDRRESAFSPGPFPPPEPVTFKEVKRMLKELETLISGEHYLSFMLILILSGILLGRNILSERVRQGSLWVTVLACALLIVQDILENYAQLDPARRNLRMVTSIAGYSLRPVAVLGFLLTVWPMNRRRWYLWIPVAFNAVLYSITPLIPLAFSFDENYAFQRGPLNGSALYICIICLILILFMVHRRFSDSRSGDIFVIYLCTLGCLGAVVADIYFGTGTLVPAILISSLTFYLFLRAQDTDHDILTRLWNRMTFYEDCRKMKNAVTAVASIDMNGLKKINDELGHEAGDRALKMISRALRDVANRKVIAYRIGGDEFMVLFVHCGETEVRQVLISLTDEVHRMGLSVSIGVAIRQGSESLE